MIKIILTIIIKIYITELLKLKLNWNWNWNSVIILTFLTKLSLNYGIYGGTVSVCKNLDIFLLNIIYILIPN